MSEHATAEQMAMPKHGEFCWNELAVEDLEKSKTFYTEIFGWSFQKSEAAGMEYYEVGLENGQRFAGMWKMTDECKGQDAGETFSPRWGNYIAVDDVDESARKAFELGGTIIHPPMDIPNVGRFCSIKDSTGASISLITLKH